eukprot:jgi/Mesvir1/26854/Mv20603-RA.2
MNVLYSDKGSDSLQKFFLYETQARFYLVGVAKNVDRQRILKIHRTEPAELVIEEDSAVYTKQEISSLLLQINDGNLATGGLQFVCKAYGIVGIIRLLELHYLILVTKRRVLGVLGRHVVYGIDNVAVIKVQHPRVQGENAGGATEKRYQKLLSGVDLTKNFFFSYTYDIMSSLQDNYSAAIRAAAGGSSHGSAGSAPGAGGSSIRSGGAGGGAQWVPGGSTHGVANDLDAPGGSTHAGSVMSAESSVRSDGSGFTGLGTDVHSTRGGGGIGVAVAVSEGMATSAGGSTHTGASGAPAAGDGGPDDSLGKEGSSHHAMQAPGTPPHALGPSGISHQGEGGGLLDPNTSPPQPGGGPPCPTGGSLPPHHQQQQYPGGIPPPVCSYENMFVWNEFLTRSMRRALGNTRWAIPLVHGFFQQVKLSVFGHTFKVCLVSRRSRHFAGTRYLKRGLNDRGCVANDVETEQMVLREPLFAGGRGSVASVVQNRGSIPLFWSQETAGLTPKPDIVLQRYDPMYEASRLHFENLKARYGNPIIILNLIKTTEKHPREMILRREFATAVSYLNQRLPPEEQLKFIHFDFHKHSKSKESNVLQMLDPIMSDTIEATDFFVSTMATDNAATAGAVAGATSAAAALEASAAISNHDSPRRAPRATRPACVATPTRRQRGVLRSNCIDCLDRTNVAQFVFGMKALGHQLHALGLSDTPTLDKECGIVHTLMDMYQVMGDVLSNQYGGSAAHNTVFQEQRGGIWKAALRSREIVTSLKRYYSNTYTDFEKQDAINLFLGNFTPEDGKPALWELDNDYYLHIKSIPESEGAAEPLPPVLGAVLLAEENFAAGSHAGAGPLDAATSAATAAAARLSTLYPAGKLTSFDKVTAAKCNNLVNVRLFQLASNRGASAGKPSVPSSATATDDGGKPLPSDTMSLGGSMRNSFDSSTSSGRATLASIMLRRSTGWNPWNKKDLEQSYDASEVAHPSPAEDQVSPREAPLSPGYRVPSVDDVPSPEDVELYQR